MKKLIFVVITFAIVGLYLQKVAAAELRIIALTLAALVVIALAGGVFFVGWWLVERLRIMRAGRIEAEKAAHVLVVTDNGETWIRDTNNRASWRNLTGTPALYVNGRPTQASDYELELFKYRLALQNAPKTVTTQAAAALPAVVQVDLLAALDPVQRCLIVGASDSGKTTLLQWLVSRRLNVSKVVVIDPHAYPAKWPTGATVVGQGRNYAEIDTALTGLVRLMTKRYDEIGRGVVAEMAHSRITILIDEWRAITGNLGRPAADAIKALLTESRKAAFSVFVASHSDRAEPLGLKGEYDLKDGFTVVKLAIVDGRRQASIDTGNGPIPATLPGPYIGQQPQVIEGELLDLEPEPDPIEAKVLELHRAGASLNEIARRVYGNIGGKQTGQIKQIIAKYEAI